MATGSSPTFLLEAETQGVHAFAQRRAKDPITEWPQLFEKRLRTIGVIFQ
jgi:hypothetical protein